MERFPTKVLLATDGSEDANLAAQAVIDISRGTGSELYLVHVLPRFPRYTYPAVTTEIYSYLLDKHYEMAYHLLHEQAERVEDAGWRVAETHVRRGSTVDEILDLVEEIGAGLIAIGSRGFGPVKRLVLGSVSEGVVHHASCPVLVVRGGRGAWPPERVVVGDDGSEAAKGAGELSMSIGKLFGVRGLLVRVYPRLPEVDVEGRRLNARMIDDELRREENKLEERAKEVEGYLGSRPKIRVSVGDAAHELLEATEEESAPEKILVAVGSRGLGAIQRMRLGSVSSKVLHAAKGPVLIYPHP